MGKQALRDELSRTREELSALRAECGDAIPRSAVSGIVSRAVQAYAEEKSQQLEIELKKKDKRLLQWEHQYRDFYGLISFISGAALAGRGKMLLAVIGDVPLVENEDEHKQLRELLTGSTDMIAAVSGAYTSLLARAPTMGPQMLQTMQYGWGELVNQYLIGLNYLRNTGKDDLLVQAAARYSPQASKLVDVRAMLSPGVKAASIDIKAFAVANILALQELEGGTQEENIQNYVDTLDQKERSDLEERVYLEITSSEVYAPKVLKWIQRYRPSEKRQINLSRQN